MSEALSILYVDDEEVNLYLFDLLLESTYQIHKAQSAEDGLVVLENHPEIRLVLTDFKMPKMDGLTFARIVTERFSNIKLMMLSAFVRTREIDAAISDGVLVDYFTKPLDRDLFVEKVESLHLT